VTIRNKRTRQTRPAMTLFCWLNVAFLLLAACRAMVPGLCTTQLAAKHAKARQASAESCCPVMPNTGNPANRAAAPNSARPSVRMTPHKHAPCGLCKLMEGMLDPLHDTVLEVPVLDALDRIHFHAQAEARAGSRARHSRGPPIIG
jgi:hypothetical protein